MPLGKVQTQIVERLVELGRLTVDQQRTIAATPDELTGEALDKILRDEHGIPPFALLVAKARALGFAPCNAARCQINAATFAHIPQEFCEKHLVLPVGEVGEALL